MGNSAAGVHLGIDTGGTFTDLVAFHPESGELTTSKTPSVPTEPGRALTDAIAVSNTRLVEGVDQFLLALAASPVIAGNDLQACARYLQRILALQPTYLNFGVIAPDGRLLCEATGHPASFNLGTGAISRGRWRAVASASKRPASSAAFSLVSVVGAN